MRSINVPDVQVEANKKESSPKGIVLNPLDKQRQSVPSKLVSIVNLGVPSGHHRNRRFHRESSLDNIISKTLSNDASVYKSKSLLETSDKEPQKKPV